MGFVLVGKILIIDFVIRHLLVMVVVVIVVVVVVWQFCISRYLQKICKRAKI